MFATTPATANIASIATGTASVRMSAIQINDKLQAAEAAIDAAIAAVAALSATIPAATREANVGMNVTHTALMHAMESCQQLVKSRTNILRSHSALKEAQLDLGIPEVAFGQFCTAPPSAELAPRHLTAVAA